MRVAALQMHAIAGDAGANLARIASAAQEACLSGVDLLVAPELARTGYGAGEDMHPLAVSADHFAGELADIARSAGIAIIAGFAERDGDAVYNSAVFVDGMRQSAYRKSHLYGTYERGLFVPAAPANTIVNVGGLKLGILICYDVEFPENVRRLALAGVDAVIVPTALPSSEHAAFIARSMIPVRAFENQLFIAYVNHCGADERFAYAGLSGIAAPDGTMLAIAEAEGEALLIAEIEPANYRASTQSNTYLADL